MARLRRVRARHLVFGLGMLALALGVSVSLWLLLARDRPGPAAGPDTLRPEAQAEGSGLDSVLEDTLGLTPQEAADVAGRLRQAAASPEGGATSLSGVLESTLGLTPEAAIALAAQLQEAVDRARAQAATPAPAAAPSGGMSDRASIGENVQFEIRDASGKIKGRGSGR